jgi:hypothetical protein
MSLDAAVCSSARKASRHPRPSSKRVEVTLHSVLHYVFFFRRGAGTSASFGQRRGHEGTAQRRDIIAPAATNSAVASASVRARVGALLAGVGIQPLTGLGQAVGSVHPLNRDSGQPQRDSSCVDAERVVLRRRIADRDEDDGAVVFDGEVARAGKLGGLVSPMVMSPCTAEWQLRQIVTAISARTDTLNVQNVER